MILNKLGSYSAWKQALVVMGILVAWALFIYVMYWVFKNVSYWVFYEDMVIETVKEMVRSGQLLKQ